MFAKLFLCWCLIVNSFSSSWGDGDNKLQFDVVFTSKRPSESPNLTQTLIKLAEDFKKEVNELKKRLTSLESQNVALTLKNEQSLTKSRETENQLKILESQDAANTLKCEKSLMKLEGSLKEKINDGLKTLEVQNLVNASKLSQLAEHNNDRLLTLESQNVQNTLMLQRWLYNQKYAGHPRNCKEVKERGYDVSAIYPIQPDFAPSPFKVPCEMKKKEGGWTYILRRVDGSQNFNLSWSLYREGFGDLSNEFWLGLEKIHHLTGYKVNELLIELVDWSNTEVYAHYTSFSVGNEDEGFLLKVLEGYSGTAGDSLNYHSNMKFSTKDKDQDSNNDGNCASVFGGGWWFNYCKHSFLTGIYFHTSSAVTNGRGIHWDKFHGGLYSLKEVRMMIRPRENK